MAKYESDIKTISSNGEMVFGILSDLNNLEKLTEYPELKDKVKDIEFDTDSCSFAVEGIGRVGFRVVERDAFKTIKFVTEHAPIQATAWIQLKSISENDTKMKLTLDAELPMMIKMMVEKKLKDGLNSIAEVLAKALSNNK